VDTRRLLRAIDEARGVPAAVGAVGAIDVAPVLHVPAAPLP
jgi:hypothetical protein